MNLIICGFQWFPSVITQLLLPLRLPTFYAKIFTRSYIGHCGKTVLLTVQMHLR